MPWRTRIWARCCWNAVKPRKPCRIVKRRSGCCRALPPCTIIWETCCASCAGTIEARAAYLQAIQLDPGLAKAHAHLGLSLKREGRLDEAAVCLKRAIELDPADPDFAEFLGDRCVCPA